MEDKNHNLRENSNQDFEFMKEKIKERPLNKKKLIRRTILTASMAAVFGLVACLTFLVLEPVISNRLYPEEPAEKITFPAESEEMLPEDMALDDKELTQESETEETEAAEDTEETDAELQEYQKIYTEIGALTKEVSRAIVTVTGVTSDVDWFDNTYESKGQTSGLIVANNGKEYLILVNKAPIDTVESINVTFCDDSQCEATMKKTDPTTGLAVLAVNAGSLSKETQDAIAIAELGSSNGSKLVGMPVVAIGSPFGNSGSVVYGAITSAGNVLNTVDSKYKLITTDIYGSQKATGVLVNLKGQVLGILNQKYNSDELKNMVAALGISELKSTIEGLSNGKDMSYLGIHGADVTAEANEKLEVPFGTYVTGIEMDSPAMKAGIQSGDVIVRLGNFETGSFDEYIEALAQLVPETEVQVTIMRKTQDAYKSMNFSVTLGELE